MRISPSSGAVASADDPNAIFETFMANRLPTGGILGEDPGGFGGGGGGTTISVDPATGGSGAEPIF
jgi:hypothetical protein